VILIPGIAGSAMEVNVEGAEEPWYFCYTNSDWRRLWLNLFALLPYEKE